MNTALAECATLTLAGAVGVFLFGVVFTHGVYGSRMAWLFGVVLPLLAITAAFALGAARYGAKSKARSVADREQDRHPPSSMDGQDPRRGVAKAIGVVALILIGIPFALAGLLLLATYA
jgi:hypothetical protein